MDKPKKLVIFDIDGTLTDSLPIYHKVVIKSLKLMGMPNINTNFYEYKYHTDSYTLKYNYEKKFEKSFDKELLNKFENILYSELLKHPPVNEINGAKICVDELLKANYAIAFATGSLLKAAKLKMNQCNIWYDENLIATSKISFDRETFVLQAIENAKSYFKVNVFEKIYSVGDGIWDLQTAQKLNLEFIGIGQKNKQHLIELGCKTHFDDLTKLVNYIKN